MTLAPPQSWNDVNKFLREGGYLSLFDKRAHDHTKKDPSQDVSFLEVVTSTIRSNPEHCKWLQAWVGIASIPDASHDAIPSIFFDTAWHIYRRDVPGALEALQRYQKVHAFPSLPGPGESRGEPSRLFAHGAAGTAEMRRASDVPSGLFDKWGERPYSPLSNISEEDSTALTERNPLLNGSHDEFIPGGPSGLLPSNEERAEGEEVDDFRSNKSCYKLRSLSRVNYKEQLRAVRPDSNKSSFEEGKKSSSTKKPRGLRNERTLHSGRPKGKEGSGKFPRQISTFPRGDTKTTARQSQQQCSPPDISNFPTQSQRALRVAARSNKRSSTGLSESVIIVSHSKKSTYHVEAKKTFQDNKMDLRKKATPWKRRQAQWTKKKKKTVMSRKRNMRGTKRVILWNVKSFQPQKKLIARRSKATLTNSTTRESTMDISSDTVRTGNDTSTSPALPTSNGADMDLNQTTLCSPTKRSHTVLVEEDIALDNDTHEPEEPPHKRLRIYQTPSISYDDISQGCGEPEPDSSPLASFSPRVSDVQGFQPDISLELDISSSTAPLSVEQGIPESPRHVSVDRMDSTFPPTSPPLGERMVQPIGILPTTPTIGHRSQICNDTPESSQSTLIGHSPISEGSSLKPVPPWKQSIDPPSPSNSARGPSDSDTHSWRVPQPQVKEGISLELLSLCFPVQPSHAELENHVKKPQLPMTPPVWAQSRQELCESLPYFRSYQGGVYTRGKKALGYLLDGHPAAQDLWHTEGRLIISHAGGNSAVDKDTKQTVLVNDQTRSSVSCAALVNSYKCNQPIVLIAGNGYNLFPYDLEHRSYVVLGYYLITKTWEEPEPSSTSLRGYFVRRKFLFQWIDSQGQPWWIQDSLNKTLSPLLSPRAVVETDDAKSCDECHHDSPQIYNFGWVCTYATCRAFFRRNGGNKGQEGYSPRFLIPRAESIRYEASRLQIRPGPPVKLEQIIDRETTSRRFWNGFCCSKCGRLSCREQWTHWECCNCHEKLLVKHRLRTGGDGTLPTGRIRFQIGENSGIVSKAEKFRHNAGVFRGRTFKLPWNRGVIYVIEGNPIANVSSDKIFSQYQHDAEDPAFFRRYCMKSHKLKGRMLSHYFSQNSGEPYKYVGGTDNTVPLDKYASVRQAVGLIRERTAMALGSDPLFNEILSAAYMADQKMEFHSDGEKDLGPVVASLSLGAPATMRFRAIPTRLKPHPSEMSEGNVRKSPPIVLTLTLRHGDILVMAGAEIQEYYQHAVHPTGFRIAATARYIKSENPCVPTEPGYASGSTLMSRGGVERVVR